MNNEQLIKNINAVEELHQQIIDDFYTWFDNNQKDNKIGIRRKLLILYYYKKDDMLYQEDSDGRVCEVNLLTMDELYDIMKIIVNKQ